MIFDITVEITSTNVGPHGGCQLIANCEIMELHFIAYVSSFNCKGLLQRQ